MFYTIVKHYLMNKEFMLTHSSSVNKTDGKRQNIIREKNKKHIKDFKCRKKP